MCHSLLLLILAQGLCFGLANQLDVHLTIWKMLFSEMPRLRLPLDARFKGRFFLEYGIRETSPALCASQTNKRLSACSVVKSVVLQKNTIGQKRLTQMSWIPSPRGRFDLV